MKIFRNHRGSFYGVTFYPFGRIVKAKQKDKSFKYYYQIRVALTKRLIEVARCRKKIFGLNKYTVSFLSIIFNAVWIPFIIIAYPIKMYFEGGYNFVRDSSWVQNVRFFNWANIIILIALTVALFLA
mgnify:CR=1 FL=1